MSLALALQEYRAATAFTNSLINTAHSQTSAGSFALPKDQIVFITESAFLRNFIAWEKFQENSFHMFLTGLPSASGKNIPRHATPPDAAHANLMTIGTQKYVDWANPEIVRRLARIYFHQGEPFESILASIQSDLLDMRTIRNSSAHISTSTSSSLEALARRKLQKPSPGITVYELLTSPDPSTNSASTVLSYYQSILDAAAVSLSNA